MIDWSKFKVRNALPTYGVVDISQRIKKKVGDTGYVGLNQESIELWINYIQNSKEKTGRARLPFGRRALPRANYSALTTTSRTF